MSSSQSPSWVADVHSESRAHVRMFTPPPPVPLTSCGSATLSSSWCVTHSAAMPLSLLDWPARARTGKPLHSYPSRWPWPVSFNLILGVSSHHFLQYSVCQKWLAQPTVQSVNTGPGESHGGLSWRPPPYHIITFSVLGHVSRIYFSHWRQAGFQESQAPLRPVGTYLDQWLSSFVQVRLTPIF